MTNKQTIDGVSREKIQRAIHCILNGTDTMVEAVALADELRALLDSNHAVCSNGILCQSSKCAECGGNGAYKPAAWERDMDYRPEELGSPETEPAAQPQGEVERLRELVKAYMNAEAEKGIELVKLRAKLAERDALLREVTDKCNVGFAMRERLLSALSASAEPKPRGEAVDKFAETVPKFKFETLVEHCKRLEADLAQSRAHVNEITLYQQNAVWFWQHDGEDYLQSLSCPIIIQPHHLRELLEGVAQHNPIAEQPSHSGDANEMVAKVVLPERKPDPAW